MRTFSFLLLVVIALSSSACYHARIETGLTPGTQTISQPFALSFIYGLIPPATVEAAEKCPNGVAVVETQLSFLNSLVSAITFGILTPMQIDVTCAAGASSSLDADQTLTVPEGATTEAIQMAFGEAADQAAETQQPVYVHFE